MNQMNRVYYTFSSRKIAFCWKCHCLAQHFNSDLNSALRSENIECLPLIAYNCNAELQRTCTISSIVHFMIRFRVFSGTVGFQLGDVTTHAQNAALSLEVARMTIFYFSHFEH